MSDPEQSELETQRTLSEISANLRKIAYFLLQDKIGEYLDSSETRSEVLELCNGNRTVNEIAEKLGKAQPNVSRAISDLVTAGLVRIHREGAKSKYYVKTV